MDESIDRLQTDRLDLYLIHEPDPETTLDETLQALDDVVRAGKVIDVGASIRTLGSHRRRSCANNEQIGRAHV